MKKFIIIIGMLVIAMSAFSQTRAVRGIYVGVGDSVVLIKSIVERDGVLLFYGATDNLLFTSSEFDTTNIYSQLDLRVELQNFEIAKIAYDDGHVYFIDAVGDTAYTADDPTSIVDLDDIKVTVDDVPELLIFYPMAGDTSNMSKPNKLGDVFFDTENTIFYIASDTITGSWVRISNAP